MHIRKVSPHSSLVYSLVMFAILLPAILLAALLPVEDALALNSTVILPAADLITTGTEDVLCYEHGEKLPCSHCACFMAMAEASGGVQFVRAGTNGYYLLGYLQEGYLEPVDELDVLVINLFVLKTDFSGQVQWFTPVRALSGQTSYPGDLLLTDDGGCILVQKRYIYETDLLYVEAARLDAQGKICWQKNLTSMEADEDNPVTVGHDSWLVRNKEGGYHASWNTLQGESWADLGEDGSIRDSGSAPEQSRPGSYKSPELQASYGEYSVSVEAPVTRIIMTLVQPDESVNTQGNSNDNDYGLPPAAQIPVLVNGVPVVFPDVQPRASAENRVLVPLRPVLEAMGITVAWSGESNQALLSDGSTNVIFTLNSSSYMIDQEVHNMDTMPVVYSQRIMLPIRFAAEAFGATASWQDGAVIIETPGTGH